MSKPAHLEKLTIGVSSVSIRIVQIILELAIINLEINYGTMIITRSVVFSIF